MPFQKVYVFTSETRRVETEEGQNVGGKQVFPVVFTVSLSLCLSRFHLSCSSGVKFSCHLLTVVLVNSTQLADLKSEKWSMRWRSLAERSSLRDTTTGCGLTAMTGNVRLLAASTMLCWKVCSSVCMCVFLKGYNEKLYPTLRTRLLRSVSLALQSPVVGSN